MCPRTAACAGVHVFYWLFGCCFTQTDGTKPQGSIVRRRGAARAGGFIARKRKISLPVAAFTVSVARGVRFPPPPPPRVKSRFPFVRLIGPDAARG